ncbi:MAG TPA: AsmA family protein, partial [Terriglobales bacterium]|nr:AsmA family protein [Terriglobales bacterium]
MRLLNRTRVLAALFVLLAVALLPPLFNMSRYRAGVANAIARALGRRVTVGEVHLRLFPQPGFTLTNLVVEDEPSFGAEPALLAGEVTADLRITSLWRGRLEIAQLSLNYPSLNLVRRSDGHWNLESLLERTTHSGAAPTGKNKPEARTRFPYIEVKNGRINLKIGQEKKAYALSDADFALWLASEGEWRVRLEARPVRTDDNLSDTGSIRLSGNFGTAPRLSDTPLSLQLTLEDAQLGQFTRLIYGRDRGWRGALNAVVQMRGTPAAVLLDANLWADNFHRFDIPTGDGFKLSATCKGRMGSLTESLEDINCTSEVGDGKLTIQGNAQWASQRLGFHLNASARKIPAEPLLLLVRRMKKDVPPDLSAAGTLDASVEVAVAPGSPWIWSGSGSTSDLVLKSGLLPRPLELGELQLQMLSSASSVPGQKPSRRQGASRRQESSRRESSHRAARKSESLPQEPTLAILPFPVPLGETSSARSQAWVTATGYRVTLAGDADAGESLSLARALGLSAPAVPLQGIARFNFEVSGTWQGFQAPQITGSAHLRSVTARIDGIGSPLLIESGTLAVSPSESILRDARFSLLNSRLQFSGWVQKPRFCVLGQPTGNTRDICQLKFQLDAGQLAMQDILELLKTVRTKTAWFGLLPSNRS